MEYQNEYLENTAESFPTPLSKFFKPLTRTEACCNNCKKILKFSTKATSNLIAHLKRCSLKLHLQCMNLKRKHQEKSKKVNKNDCQVPIKSFFQTSSSQEFASYDVAQKALTKALLKSISCDQLPLSIDVSQTFINFVLTAEPKFVIPRRSTIRNSLIPTAIQQMEEIMRRELARLPHVYLTIDFWTNRNMASFLGITVHFIDVEWKLRTFVLAADSFLEKHTACNIAKSYDNVIEKFKLTSKVTKVVPDNASSIIKAFQVSLPEFILHKTGNEGSGNDKQLPTDFVFEQDFVENGTDLNALLAYLSERVSCFAHTKQLCIKDCLQDPEFLKSYIGKQLAKVANFVNSVRKSVNATSYLQSKKITLRAKNVTRWNSQLVMLQSVLKDHEEVNATLTMIQSRDKRTNQDYLALSELVSVLLPFKEAVQQVEGENVVTSSCICPVVVGLMKTLGQLKNSNLSYCKKLATNLQHSVSKRLLPYLNSVDNRLASLLDPRFKHKWIEDDVQKEEAGQVLITYLASRLGQCEEDGSTTSSDDEKENSAKKPKLFGFMATGSKKRSTNNSVKEVERYLKEEIIHFDEDPLMYWKKSQNTFPRLLL